MKRTGQLKWSRMYAKSSGTSASVGSKADQLATGLGPRNWKL